MTPRVYVCAPYALAAFVRDVHAQLEDIGCKPVSAWAELATTSEGLTDEKQRAQRACWEINCIALDSADAVLVIGADQGGGETFAEVGRALTLGKPVVWCGRRRILSCYSPGVVLCATEKGQPRTIYDGIDEAMDLLSRAAHADSQAAIREVIFTPKVKRVPTHLHSLPGGST